ncbi:hypothetical protein DFH27DRAFT_105209 [Peziza echinospora]|nr:hypothetical protein DFH27DRAFT_105209 [Peziza echinospora]
MELELVLSFFFLVIAHAIHISESIREGRGGLGARLMFLLLCYAFLMRFGRRFFTLYLLSCFCFCVLFLSCFEFLFSYCNCFAAHILSYGLGLGLGLGI